MQWPFLSVLFSLLSPPSSSLPLSTTLLMVHYIAVCNYLQPPSTKVVLPHYVKLRTGYVVCFSQQNEGTEVYHIWAESSGAGWEFTMYISFSMRPAILLEEASWSGVKIMWCRVLADLDGYVVWVKNTSFLCRTSKGREILLL